jgi:hypothetical protein
MKNYALTDTKHSVDMNTFTASTYLTLPTFLYPFIIK